MKFESLEAIVNFAIEKEKEAAEFYETTSKQEKFSGVKEMFLEFAGEERKHQKLLEGFGKECSTKKAECVGKDVAAYKLKWIADLKRSDFAVDIEYKPGMAYNELLMLAMKREEKALKLYNELLKEADSPEGKKLFQVLCQEEAKHKLTLEKMYDDHMAKMGD